MNKNSWSLETHFNGNWMTVGTTFLVIKNLMEEELGKLHWQVNAHPSLLSRNNLISWILQQNLHINE